MPGRKPLPDNLKRSIRLSTWVRQDGADAFREKCKKMQINNDADGLRAALAQWIGEK